MRYLLNKLFFEKNHFVNDIYCVKGVYRNLYFCTVLFHRWPPCGFNLYLDFWCFDFSIRTIETTQDSL